MEKGAATFFEKARGKRPLHDRFLGCREVDEVPRVSGTGVRKGRSRWRSFCFSRTTRKPGRQRFLIAHQSSSAWNPGLASPEWDGRYQLIAHPGLTVQFLTVSAKRGRLLAMHGFVKLSASPSIFPDSCRGTHLVQQFLHSVRQPRHRRIQPEPRVPETRSSSRSKAPRKSRSSHCITLKLTIVENQNEFANEIKTSSRKRE